MDLILQRIRSFLMLNFCFGVGFTRLVFDLARHNTVMTDGTDTGKD